MDLKIKRKQVKFDELDENQQVTVLRGIAQQITLLGFPKLEAINHHYKCWGLVVVSLESLRRVSDTVIKEADSLKHTVDKIGKTQATGEELITQIKMICVATQTSNSDKVSKINELLKANNHAR